MGLTGTRGGGDVQALILSAALRLPIRAVRGYAGSAEIRQAIDTGEVDGTCLSQQSFQAVYVPHENYALAIQGGTEVSEGFENVPLALTLTDDPDAQALLKALALVQEVGRFYALPPETPDDLASQVRHAFLRTMADPVFRQNAANARLSIDPMSGEEVSANIRSLLQLPKRTRARLGRIVAASP